MKQLQIKATSDTVQEVKTLEKSEFKLIAKLRPRNGHTVFEYNMATGEVSEAEFEKMDLAINFRKSEDGVLYAYNVSNKRIIRKPNCIYDSSLNVKNFKKKIKAGANAAP
jgi:hypothetical protein